MSSSATTGNWGERLRGLWREYAELAERRMILDRPWTHDDLHWATDEHGVPELHGTRSGDLGRRGPVTRGGWCPCGRNGTSALW